jgi:hypothetical protein
VKIGIGVDQNNPNNQGPSSGWNLAYTWATTLAPSIQTTQQQDASVSSVVANEQASALVPIVNTSSSVSVSILPNVVSASASSGVPTVSTTKSPNITSVTATAQATSGVPSVSTGSTVNTSISSIVAESTASAGVPTVSTTTGTTTTYLQMDGVDDYLKTPLVTVTRIVLDFLYVNDPTSTLAQYLFDPRGGTTGNFMVYITTANVLSKGNNVSTLLYNGSSTIPSPLPQSTRGTVDATFSTAVTEDSNGIEFFINFAAQTTSMTKGNIYDIKLYNGATLVAHYDMSTGNVNDQSGNGNNATILNGGTWVTA